MEVLAAAAVSQQEHLERAGSPGGSAGSSEHQGAAAGRRQFSRAAAAAATKDTRGGSSSPPPPLPLPPAHPAGTAAVAAGGARTKAAVAAEVAEAYAVRIASEPEAALAKWTAEVHDQIPAADAAFVAARDAHMQADAARAAARDAFRADQKSEEKSAEWHARVAAAQQAHEALREAREALYRLQALGELLSRELQRRRGGQGSGSGGGGGRTSGRRSSEPADGGSNGGAADAAAGAAAAAAAAAGVAAEGGAVVEERLLVPPALQGTKRKRGAPPESCPFCNHSYTVRDGLSSRLDPAGNRLHLRRCQCRKKTPPCRNCPECKQRPDVMQITDTAAAFELCQRLYGCAICACRCPGAGKWIESDIDSRQAFRERTQKRQEELAQLGWQDTSAAAQPTSTAGGTTSAATAAPSTSMGQEAVQRPRRHHPQLQQQPARSAPSTRRLPADIREQLEQLQAQRQGQGAGQGQGHGQPPAGQAQGQGQSLMLGSAQAPGQAFGQSLSSAGWQAGPPPLPPGQWPRPADSHQPVGTAGGAAPSTAQGKRQHHHHHHHHHHSSQGHLEHHHTCSHPHEDCTSDCCSAPTVAAPGTAAAAVAEAAAAAAAAAAASALLPRSVGAMRPGRPADLLLPPPGSMPPAPGANSSLLQLWDQLAAAGWPTGATAASLQPQLPVDSQQAPLPSLPLPLLAQPLASAPPELPPEVMALVQEVFAHAAGEQMAAAVTAFLRRQRLSSLRVLCTLCDSKVRRPSCWPAQAARSCGRMHSDFEFLELSWLERELGPLGLPPLLLNKFLVLGKRKAAAGATLGAPAAPTPAAVAAANAAATAAAPTAAAGGADAATRAGLAGVALLPPTAVQPQLPAGAAVGDTCPAAGSCLPQAKEGAVGAAVG